MASRHEARLRALEARLKPSPELVARAHAVLERLEALEPGGAASAIRQLGFADRLPGTVAQSDTHAGIHAAAAPCQHCGPTPYPANFREVTL